MLNSNKSRLMRMEHTVISILSSDWAKFIGRKNSFSWDPG